MYFGNDIFFKDRTKTHLNAVLVHRLNEEDHFVTLLEKALDEGRLDDLLTGGAGHEVDVLLLVLHTLDVVGQRGLLGLRVR